MSRRGSFVSAFVAAHFTAAFTFRRDIVWISNFLFWWTWSSAAQPINAIRFGACHSGMNSSPFIHVGRPWALWYLQHRSESKVTLLCKVVGSSERGPELSWNDNSVFPHISLILLYVLRDSTAFYGFVSGYVLLCSMMFYGMTRV